MYLHLRECLAETVQLIDKVKDDFDAFIIHTEITLKIVNEERPGSVYLGKEDRFGLLLGKKPSAFDPPFKWNQTQYRSAREIRPVLSSRSLSRIERFSRLPS